MSTTTSPDRARLDWKRPEPKNGLPRISVGKDLDGCHYLFDKGWYETAVSLGRIDAHDHPYQRATRWEFYEHYNVDLAGFLAVCNEGADKGLLWAQSAAEIPGGAPAWRDLADDGHYLHVKTDRSFGTHPVASEAATRAWLAATGRSYDTITFGKDKTAGPVVDIMLEDKIENYDDLDAAGVEVWLIDQLWNQDDGSRRRVYSHDEFVRRVKAMQERRAAAGA